MGNNKIDKLSGKAKKTQGKITGNKTMQAKGMIQEGKGKVKESFDNRFK